MTNDFFLIGIFLSPLISNKPYELLPKGVYKFTLFKPNQIIYLANVNNEQIPIEKTLKTRFFDKFTETVTKSS